MADRRHDATTDEHPRERDGKDRVPSTPPARPLNDWDEPRPRSGTFRFPRS